VLVPPAFVRTHALLGTRRVGKRKHTYVGGTYETIVAEIAWFELAGHRFEKPTVEIAPPEEWESSLEGIAGIIGHGFLRRFTIVLNYPEARIAFLPK
jgi:hypothetical protein